MTIYLYYFAGWLKQKIQVVHNFHREERSEDKNLLGLPSNNWQIDSRQNLKLQRTDDHWRVTPTPEEM